MACCWVLHTPIRCSLQSRLVRTLCDIFSLAVIILTFWCLTLLVFHSQWLMKMQTGLLPSTHMVQPIITPAKQTQLSCTSSCSAGLRVCPSV